MRPSRQRACQSDNDNLATLNQLELVKARLTYLLSRIKNTYDEVAVSRFHIPMLHETTFGFLDAELFISLLKRNKFFKVVRKQANFPTWVKYSVPSPDLHVPTSDPKSIKAPTASLFSHCLQGRQSLKAHQWSTHLPEENNHQNPSKNNHLNLFSGGGSSQNHFLTKND